MATEKQSDSQKDNWKAAYEQLCTSYHAIDDFRTKLLGILPLATGTGIFLFLNNLTPETEPFLVPLGVFGFVVTLGLFFYEIYGIARCTYLIKVGQVLENHLGLNKTDGQFLSRPDAILGFINEPFAAGVIYPAVLASWLYLALVFTAPQSALAFAILIFLVGLVLSYFYQRYLKKKLFPD
jgi:hypothetical protein